MAALKTNTIEFDGRPGEPGAISRVVPGRLVYVEIKPTHTTKRNKQKHVYAFKPDKVVIRDNDGAFRKYRGEPFGELGLTVGQQVVVLPAERGKSEALVIYKHQHLGSSQFFSGFIEKFDLLKSK